jgi:hypothetical protein
MATLRAREVAAWSATALCRGTAAAASRPYLLWAEGSRRTRGGWRPDVHPARWRQWRPGQRGRAGADGVHAFKVGDGGSGQGMGVSLDGGRMSGRELVDQELGRRCGGGVVAS